MTLIELTKGVGTEGSVASNNEIREKIKNITKRILFIKI
jgi:hypothetical protein